MCGTMMVAHALLSLILFKPVTKKGGLTYLFFLTMICLVGLSHSVLEFWDISVSALSFRMQTYLCVCVFLKAFPDNHTASGEVSICRWWVG